MASPPSLCFSGTYLFSFSSDLGKNGKVPKAALTEDTQAGGSSYGRKGRILLNLYVALALPRLWLKQAKEIVECRKDCWVTLVRCSLLEDFRMEPVGAEIEEDSSKWEEI